MDGRAPDRPSTRPGATGGGRRYIYCGAAAVKEVAMGILTDDMKRVVKDQKLGFDSITAYDTSPSAPLAIPRNRSENPGVGGLMPSLPTISAGCAALLGESSSYSYLTPGGRGPA
jgi:hypothetical protein